MSWSMASGSDSAATFFITSVLLSTKMWWKPSLNSVMFVDSDNSNDKTSAKNNKKLHIA